VPLSRNIAAAVIHKAWEWVTVAGAIGPQDERGRRFAAMGKGSCLSFPQGAVFGEPWIALGTETLIGANVSLAVGLPGEDMGTGTPPVIVIGDRCNIGRGSYVVGRCGIVIGDDVATGPNVYITDHNHSYDKLDVPIGRQWVSEEPVEVGAGSWLGANVVVLPGARIGRHVTVAAGSVVRGELPDYSVCAGAPAKVVRRHVDGEGWVPPLSRPPVDGPKGWPGNE
jgi:acetyltransferase-like isoleucine patch superfamily enzyme